MELTMQINGVPIEEAYDKMSKDEFIAHIMHYVEGAETRLNAWRFIADMKSPELKEQI